MTRKTSENLSADIYKTLKKRIVFWEYPPGHRFTEAELCQEFGVSRTPIREVLRMLVENDLVDKQTNKGYTVKQPNLDEMAELYDVRLALELYIVDWLARHDMDEDIWLHLNTIWQEMARELPDDITDVADIDEEFHESLALCTANQTLTQYLKNINERIHFIRLTDITSKERLHITCEQHLNILKYIKEKNVESARQMIQMNIEGGRNNVELAIKEALMGSYLSSTVSV